MMNTKNIYIHKNNIMKLIKFIAVIVIAILSLYSCAELEDVISQEDLKDFYNDIESNYKSEVEPVFDEYKKEISSAVNEYKDSIGKEAKNIFIQALDNIKSWFSNLFNNKDDKKDESYSSFRKEITVLFKGYFSGANAHVPAMWDDSYFYSKNNEFNYDLAYLSSTLSAAAYNAEDRDYNKWANIESALLQCGFNSQNGNMQFYNYDDTQINEVAYTITSKTISNGKEEHLLIAIVIRGTYEGIEWVGDFNPGLIETGERNHKNFEETKDGVYEIFDYYYHLMKHQKDYGDNVKVYITGHSRGAAIAELLSVEIQKNKLVSKSNVYTYTFATPKTTKMESYSGTYPNIFNIINGYDIIPKLPSWYYNYGKSMLLPEKSTALFNERFNYITGDKYLSEKIYEDIKEAYEEFFVKFLKNPNIVIRAAGITMKQLEKQIAFNHTPETYISWLYATDEKDYR